MNVIVTGIPRAGTTLAAALIDALPNMVCLNEPVWHNAKAATNAETFVQFIAGDYARLRGMLLAQTPIPDRRTANGEALTNYFSRLTDGRMRSEFVEYPFVREGLSKDFTLAIKHNGPYLAVLPELIATKQFKIIAIIRHPLPVISSWRRLQLPISRGEMPNAKAYWRELHTLIDSKMALLEKQIRLYDIMLERIFAYAAHITIIRYESLIVNPSLIAQTLAVQGPMPAIVKPPVSIPMDEELVKAIKRFSHYAKY